MPKIKPKALDKKNVVQSIAKSFAVLQAFGPDTPELVMANVARAAGIDNATAFRMLNTLEMLGYVERVPDSRYFRLTLKCLDLGFNAIARSDLRTLARPVLRQIVGEQIEAASIGVLDHHDIVYIERIQAGLHRLAVDVRIGNRVPAFSSALGRAILSRMPDAARRRVVKASKPQRLTEKTLVDIDLILETISEAERLGYAVSEQETVSGLRVIAAPITDADGAPVAAISAAAPAYGRTLAQFVSHAAPALMAAAKHLSKAATAPGGMSSQH